MNYNVVVLIGVILIQVWFSGVDTMSFPKILYFFSISEILLSCPIIILMAQYLKIKYHINDVELRHN